MVDFYSLLYYSKFPTEKCYFNNLWKNFQWLSLKTNKQYSNNSFPRITLYLSSQYNIHIIYHNIYIFASKVKLHTYYPYLNFQTDQRL